MKTISNDFRDALRGIKQTNGRITYTSGDTPYILTTEDNYNLNTENSFDIGTEKGLGDLESDKLYGINPVFDVPLLKTICKSLELDSAIDIPINTEINAEIGVLVDNDYEYINFGKYYVKSSIYQLDTKTYKITCYDAMADAMVKYDNDSAFTNLTISGVVNEICSRLGWTTSISNNTAITDVWRTQQMTYRDILDELCSILGNMYLTDDKELMAIKPLEQNEVSETITDEDMKNTAVNIGKQVEITKAMVTQSDVTLYEKGTGENAFKFNNNHLLMAQTNLRETACDNIIGLTYYPFDIETWGLLIYDPLDKVSIEHDGETYTTYILKDDIKYQRGLEERIETTDELSSINGMTFYSQEEQATRDAQIRIDKANAEIELKVSTSDYNNQKITQMLNDGSNNTAIKSSKISLTNKEINLTSDNIVIDSTYFNVDKDGNMDALGTNLAILDNGMYLATNHTPGTALVNNTGVLNTMVFDSYNYIEVASNGSYCWGDIPTLSSLSGNYSLCGQALDTTFGSTSTTGWFNLGCGFSVYIPTNFTVTNAFIYAKRSSINWQNALYNISGTCNINTVHFYSVSTSPQVRYTSNADASPFAGSLPSSKTSITSQSISSGTCTINVTQAIANITKGTSGNFALMGDCSTYSTSDSTYRSNLGLVDATLYVFGYYKP